MPEVSSPKASAPATSHPGGGRAPGPPNSTVHTARAIHSHACEATLRAFAFRPRFIRPLSSSFANFMKFVACETRRRGPTALHANVARIVCRAQTWERGVPTLQAGLVRRCGLRRRRRTCGRKVVIQQVRLGGVEVLARARRGRPGVDELARDAQLSQHLAASATSSKLCPLTNFSWKRGRVLPPSTSVHSSVRTSSCHSSRLSRATAPT